MYPANFETVTKIYRPILNDYSHPFESHAHGWVGHSGIIYMQADIAESLMSSGNECIRLLKFGLIFGDL
jgi:hypothetical protein